jgi:hypothetical protein
VVNVVGSAVVVFEAGVFVDVNEQEAMAEPGVGEWDHTMQLRRWARWIPCSSRVRMSKPG